MRKTKFIFFVLLSLWMTNCSHYIEPVSSENLLIRSDQNYQILPDETLEVIIENPTKQCFAFPLGYGIEISTLVGNQLIEIKNLIKYSGEEEIRVTPFGSVYDSRKIRIKPDIGSLNIKAPIKFTAQIKGYLCENKESWFEKDIIFYVYQ